MHKCDCCILLPLDPERCHCSCVPYNQLLPVVPLSSVVAQPRYVINHATVLLYASAALVGSAPVTPINFSLTTTVPLICAALPFCPYCLKLSQNCLHALPSVSPACCFCESDGQ